MLAVLSRIFLARVEGWALVRCSDASTFSLAPQLYQTLATARLMNFKQNVEEEA